MITHQLTQRCLCVSFWPKSCLNHRIHRTWPLLTFSSSQNWRHPWKESVLQRLRRYKKNRNRRYQNARLRSISRIGKNAVISVLYLRGVTLKRTRELLMPHTAQVTRRKDKFLLKNFTWQFFIYSQNFCQKSAKGHSQKKTFSYFVLLEMSKVAFEAQPHIYWANTLRTGLWQLCTHFVFKLTDRKRLTYDPI